MNIHFKTIFHNKTKILELLQDSGEHVSLLWRIKMPLLQLTRPTNMPTNMPTAATELFKL